MDADEKKKIKLIILAIAEMLEVTLTEGRLLLYSKALEDLGSLGMEEAFQQLLADPWMRAGKMPLPGQIRELAQGPVDVEADYAAMEIMRVVKTFKPAEWKQCLTKELYGLVLCYGVQTMEEMQTGESPTIMSQIRALCKTQAVTRRRLRATEHALTHGRGKNLALESILESPAKLEEFEHPLKAVIDKTFDIMKKDGLLP